jgi:hypothetical protein
MNKNTLYNPYILEITLSKRIQEGRYFIEKGSGIRNKKEVNKEDFDILQLVLDKGRIREYYTQDYTKRVIEEVSEYQVFKNTTPYTYLEGKYEDIIENVYRGTLIYYKNKSIVERIVYSDNDEIHKTEITLELARTIINIFIETNQDLTIVYAKTGEDPREATELSEGILNLIEGEKRQILEETFRTKETNEYIEFNEYINLDPENDKDNKMQEISRTIPRTPSAESDDSQDNKKRNNQTEIRETTQEKTD